MRKFKRFFIPVLVLSLLRLSAVFAAEPGWELRKDEDGIRIYSRALEGFAVEEFESLTTVKTSIADVMALIEDDQKVCKWLSKCKEFREIAEPDSGGKFFYLQNRLPVPMANRDCVIKRIRETNVQTQSVTYTFLSYPEMIPQQKKVVRIPYLKLVWQFTPAADGTVAIHAKFHIDPGGSIPKWLANQGCSRVSFNSLKRFRKLLEESQTKVYNGAGG